MHAVLKVNLIPNFTTALSSIAQTKSYRGFVEGGSRAFVGSKTGSVISLSTSHGKMFGPVFVGGGIGIEQAWIKNESYIEGYISPDGWDGSSLGIASWLYGETGTGCRMDD